MPKLKGAVFESAVVERYRRREQSVEEAPVGMYLAVALRIIFLSITRMDPAISSAIYTF